MKRTRIRPELEAFPSEFRPFLEKGNVYDSSCSAAARVYYLEAEGGMYLKTAPAGTLKAESDMTRYLHDKDLATEVLAYRSLDRDWLLTRKLPGEDCAFPEYLENPKRLCDTLASLLRQLHDQDFTGCPVSDRCRTYRETAQRNYQVGKYDPNLFPPDWGFSSREDAWAVVREGSSALLSDTLIHGDYCLPNVMLDQWRFSGFLDLDCAGVGDRHIDLFWGVWTLFFNLKTNAYFDRFLDAYGRERVEPELLRTVAAFEVFG